MNLRALAATVAIAAASAGLGACSSEPTDRLGVATTDLASSMHAYVDDAGFRRRALEKSLVRGDNGYAVLRLLKYDEAHWGQLPELDALTTPVLVGADGAPTASKLVWPSISRRDTNCMFSSDRIDNDGISRIDRTAHPSGVTPRTTSNLAASSPIREPGSGAKSTVIASPPPAGSVAGSVGPSKPSNSSARRSSVR